MISKELFKIRTINGLKRTASQSQKILTDISITEEDIPEFKELNQFLDNLNIMIEDFAREEGI